MSDSPDMNAPVTRRELHEALELWAGAINARADARFAQQDAKLAELRAELRALILSREEVLVARIESIFDPHRGVPERVRDLENEELPARVSKLEAHVFAPRRRAPKTARRPAKRRKR